MAISLSVVHVTLGRVFPLYLDREQRINHQMSLFLQDKKIRVYKKQMCGF